MSDIKKYVEKRKKSDPAFDTGFDAGYETFKLGVLLKQAREPEIDRLWAEEAERRITQIDKGEVELVFSEKVFAKIREKYRNGSI